MNCILFEFLFHYQTEEISEIYAMHLQAYEYSRNNSKIDIQVAV